LRIIIKLSTVISIIMFIIAGCQNVEEELASRDLVDKCKELRIGMQYNAVIEKMGEPINANEFEKDGRIKKRLYFPSPRLASTFVQCVIDTQSGLVEEIICDEEYKLTSYK
jgi:hypothetical protein